MIHRQLKHEIIWKMPHIACGFFKKGTGSNVFKNKFLTRFKYILGDEISSKFTICNDLQLPIIVYLSWLCMIKEHGQIKELLRLWILDTIHDPAYNKHSKFPIGTWFINVKVYGNWEITSPIPFLQRYYPTCWLNSVCLSSVW